MLALTLESLEKNLDLQEKKEKQKGAKLEFELKRQKVMPSPHI